MTWRYIYQHLLGSFYSFFFLLVACFMAWIKVFIRWIQHSDQSAVIPQHSFHLPHLIFQETFYCTYSKVFLYLMHFVIFFFLYLFHIGLLYLHFLFVNHKNDKVFSASFPFCFILESSEIWIMKTIMTIIVTTATESKRTVFCMRKRIACIKNQEFIQFE